MAHSKHSAAAVTACLRPAPTFRSLGWLSGALLGLLLCGCTAPRAAERPSETLLATLADRNQAETLRTQALARLLARTLSPAQDRRLADTLAAILAGGPGESVRVREAALATAPRWPERTASMVGNGLLATRNPALRQAMTDSLAAHGDAAAIGYLATAWAEGAFTRSEGKDTQDTEAAALRRAISQLGGPLPEALATVISDNQASVRLRVGALAALREDAGHGETLTIIAALPSREGDTFLREVQWWAQNYGYVPTNAARLMQCHAVLNLPAATRKLLAERWALVAEEQPGGFDIRDAYVLTTAEEGLTRRGRAALVEGIAVRLAQLDQAGRVAGYAGGPDDYRQDFAGQHKQLRYSDLVGIELLLRALALPAVRALLHEYVAEDVRAIDREVGGLCLLGGPDEPVRFVAYPSAATSDRHYADSPALIRDGAYSLARWHCHADVWEGAALAGPGVDDFAYARWNNYPVIVITRLDARLINVDYCTPAGVVIDLGVYD